MQITPIPHLTTAQLRELGSAAADRGEQIYEAEIRSGLTSTQLIEFEAGYFARQFEAQGHRLDCLLMDYYTVQRRISECGLVGDSLLLFEQAYFERRFSLDAVEA